MDVATFVDLALDAALLGWAATALFCAVAGVAIALWGGIRWPLGLLAGLVLLHLGLLVLLVVAAARVQNRVRDVRTARAAPSAATAGPIAAAPVPFGAAAPVPVYAGADAVASGVVGRPGRRPRAAHAPVPDGPGARLAVRRGWVRFTRTRPTRTEYVVLVVAVLLAVALVVVTQLTWLKLTTLGYGVVSVGAFEIQLGLFAVLSALVALGAGVGVLRVRSAWWPVLLAWFGSWWLFVGAEVLFSASGSLAELNRLLADQVRDRFGVDARPELQLGVAWSVMVGLAVAMLVLAVVLLVLQGRRPSHYRPHARP